MNRSRSLMLNSKSIQWANAICSSCRASLISRIQTRWKSDYWDHSPATHVKKIEMEVKVWQRGAGKGQELKKLVAVLEDLRASSTFTAYSFEPDTGAQFVKEMATVDSFQQFNKLHHGNYTVYSV